MRGRSSEFSKGEEFSTSTARSWCKASLNVSVFLQRGKELALQRQRLKLFRCPLRTSYYFLGSASSALARGFLWLVKHRVTLFLLLPLLLTYAGIKLTGISSCITTVTHPRKVRLTTLSATFGQEYVNCPNDGTKDLKGVHIDTLFRGARETLFVKLVF